VSLIYGVSFPVFCRLQDDKERFHAWYLKATSVAAIIVTPLLLGLAVVAPDFTVVVYGAAWADMAGCLRILCIAGLLNSIHMLGGAAIEASGRLRYEVAAQSVYGLMIPWRVRRQPVGNRRRRGRCAGRGHGLLRQQGLGTAPRDRLDIPTYMRRPCDSRVGRRDVARGDRRACPRPRPGGPTLPCGACWPGSSSAPSPTVSASHLRAANT